MQASTRTAGVLIVTAFATFAAFAQEYAYEAKDWGVAARTSPKRGAMHAPTPLTVPGAKTIKTVELKEMLAKDPTIPAVDVLGSKNSLKGAVGMPGAGDSVLLGLEKEKFPKVLESLTGGDKKRPIVFFCLSSECWMSYNSSLHAVSAGYENVLWYRGGTDAWKGASGDFEPLKRAPGW